MSNGWDTSAQAWIDSLSERGDWGREHVLDPALLENGLHLTFFAEPGPVSGEASRQARFRRVPWFVVMEWRRPVAA